MNRTVSVVLATYNGERYLEEQLQSILAQSYANLEIIISDDNSGDSTISLVKSYACKDSRIKLLTNPKQIGIVPNFLNALKSATGNYICFSDQDDYWEREKVKTLVELIEQNNQNMLAYSDLGICDQGLGIRSPSFWRSSGIRPLQGCCDERILIRNLTPGCSMLFRGEVKKKLETSSIHPPFMHDHLAFALSSAIGRVVFTPQPLVRYRQHSGNSIGVDNSSAFDATAFAVG